MSDQSVPDDDFYAQRAIREIIKKYERLDGDFEKITHFPANARISSDGKSLLDDIEFFLGQPGLGRELEQDLFEIIQSYSMKYLLIRRA